MSFQRKLESRGEKGGVDSGLRQNDGENTCSVSERVMRLPRRFAPRNDNILLALFIFDFFDFFKAGVVPAAFVFGIQEILNNSFDFPLFLFRRQTAYLGVIMQAGAVGGKDVVALGGADAAHLIGGDTHTDARAAN
jgi:hypothetical protein